LIFKNYFLGETSFTQFKNLFGNCFLKAQKPLSSYTDNK